ncbi:MAG: tRNA 2-thiouridine(34) synthase MnmA [Christensenellaceae bacterium]|jgi:tRNA-specific 2-thiouridylase|nr:tRNA 2-thiouridine(34) synthase MnmA [Christensenellaceae bacterium]
MGTRKKIVLGMSGGVDSSVAAVILKELGYEVIGIYMRNWHETMTNGTCSAELDYVDVRRVACLLEIPYYTIDLSHEYSEKVFKLFLDEYKAGRTPNPDVLCNREIKFGPFKDFADKLGADYIATGHYAGIVSKDDGLRLVRAKDENKDQTYFLNQVRVEQLKKVVFPLADLTKTEVRDIAKKHGLPTADKKDSTGICFIGERKFREFLSTYIPMQEGEIYNLDGKLCGTHKGVFYYTIGQRKGLAIGGGGNGNPYFVVKKDVEKNILYVNQGECKELFSTQLIATNLNLINEKIVDGMRVSARIRHRQQLVDATVYSHNCNSVRIVFDTPVRAVTPGQYAVIYKEKVCIGGGVIE